jgi:hypothetical protein
MTVDLTPGGFDVVLNVSVLHQLLLVAVVPRIRSPPGGDPNRMEACLAARPPILITASPA